MKKVFTFVLALLLTLSIVSAININVQKISENEVLIKNLKQPTSFNLKITNNGDSDYFEFYNLLGFKVFPVGTTPIAREETKEITLQISPIGDFDYKGMYTLPYYIRSNDGSQKEEKLMFRVVDLNECFEIGSGQIDPESNTLNIYIHNKVNFNFNKLNVKFTSSFFNLDEEVSLNPYEKKEFSIKLNKDDFKKLMAGYYILNAEIKVDSQKTNVEGVIKFIEKDILTTTKRDFGLIVNTLIIEKRNEGNAVSETEVILKKNIISRIFTSFSPEPDITERQDTTVYYSWKRNVKPGETFQVAVKTNWLIPLLIILFLISVVLLSKQYSKTNLIMKKKVSFVKAKGGEFALKVSITLHAKKFVERISITDKIPPLVKLHEKFLGDQQPSRVDEKARTINWNFQRLDAGETRVISYIIYSKIGVVGRFALPSASAIFEREGTIHESESNKAFFVVDQNQKSFE